MDIISTGAAAAALLIAAAAPPSAPPAPPIMITPQARVAPPMPSPPPPPEPLLPKGTHVRIGFDPPLGVPIRYRLIDAKTSGDGKREVQMVDITVRFERRGDGYRLESRTEPQHLPPKLANDPMIKLMERPIVFDLDRDGAVVGIEDEEAHWKDADTFVEALVRDPKLDAKGAALVRESVARVRQMPLAERLDLLAANVDPIIDNGIEMNVGDSIDGAPEVVTIPFPVPDPKVRRVSTQTLVEASAGSARIDLITRFDPGDMAKLLRELSQLGPTGRAADKALQLVQSVTHHVDRRTGLLLWLEETDRDAGDPAGLPARTRRLIRANW